ncbi:putative U3 small nucleolar RNA-associated protein 11 [Styela clava]
MSAFKKAQKAKQRPHRERAQPESRRHLGILEKKKDYKERADNFHSKEKRIKILRKKALEKNPDEFYHKMIHKRLTEGELWLDNKRPEDTMTEAQKKLMASQDLNYVSMRLQMEKKKIAKLSEFIDLADKPQNTRTIFVDSKEEAKRFEPDESFVPLSLQSDHPEVVKHKEEKEKLKRELEKRKERAMELQIIVDKMELQKHLADSSVKRQKIEKETKTSAAIYKWQSVRKR